MRYRLYAQFLDPRPHLARLVIVASKVIQDEGLIRLLLGLAAEVIFLRRLLPLPRSLVKRDEHHIQIFTEHLRHQLDVRYLYQARLTP